MQPDYAYRTFLTVGLLLFLPVGLYYRIRSQATREKLDRRQEGWFILATLRPIGLIFMASSITYLVNPQRMAWSSLPLPAWVRWGGAGLWIVAAGLTFWTFHTLGRNLTDTVVTRQAHTLVTRGPYRWIRHPFYDSVALMALASSLIAANWFLLLTGGLLFVLMAVRSRKEEQNLLARFGEPYREYRAKTGRYLPRIGH